jgi:hypothetical protein
MATTYWARKSIATVVTASIGIMLTAGAIAIASQLPDDLPWGERRDNLIAQAEARKMRQTICRRVLPFLDCV